MVCARFGWRCLATDTLGCLHCDARLEYSAPSADAPEARAAAVAAVAQRLSSAHAASCAWRSESCPQSFAGTPLPILLFLPFPAAALTRAWLCGSGVPTVRRRGAAGDASARWCSQGDHGSLVAVHRRLYA